MAPDLNSVPSSPRQHRARLSQPSSTANSRRPSQVIPVSGASPAMLHSPVFAHSEQSGMPLRHPRPMTAAELHLELEKEQEAVVNRLTRELSLLRAQNSASVASNASSAASTTPSLLPIDPADPNPTHQITGPTHPTPSRRHRSSRNISARNIPTPSSTTTTTTSSIAGSVSAHPSAGLPHHNQHHAPHQGQSQASADRAAAATGASLSRNPSMSASGTSTPARQSLDHQPHPGSSGAPGGLTLPHRPPLSGREPSFASQTSTHATLGSSAGATSPSGGGGGAAPGSAAAPTSNPAFTVPGGSGVADAEKARQELDAVKGENEVLKERIRALERLLRQRRRESGGSEVSGASAVPQSQSQRGGALGTGIGGGGAGTAGGISVSAWAAASSGGATGVAGPRERSESQSTEASVRRRLDGLAQEERDEVVKVGESAGNSGLR